MNLRTRALHHIVHRYLDELVEPNTTDPIVDYLRDLVERDLTAAEESQEWRTAARPQFQVTVDTEELDAIEAKVRDLSERIQSYVAEQDMAPTDPKLDAPPPLTEAFVVAADIEAETPITNAPSDEPPIPEAVDTTPVLTLKDDANGSPNRSCIEYICDALTKLGGRASVPDCLTQMYADGYKTTAVHVRTTVRSTAASHPKRIAFEDGQMVLKTPDVPTIEEPIEADTVDEGVVLAVRHIEDCVAHGKRINAEAVRKWTGYDLERTFAFIRETSKSIREAQKERENDDAA